MRKILVASLAVGIGIAVLKIVRPWPDSPAPQTALKESEATAPAADPQPAPVSEQPQAPAVSAPVPQRQAAPHQEELPAPPPAAAPEPLDRQRLAEALEPLMAYQMPERDLALVKEAVRLSYRKDFAAARPLLAKIGDATAQTLAQWYYLRARGNDAPPAETAAFRRDHPLWPSKELLDGNAEIASLMQELSPAAIIDFYHDRPPETGAGKAALGGALIATGEAGRGRALIREAWRRHDLDEDVEAAILKRFEKALRPEDHKRRVDWLLAKDDRDRLDAVKRLRKRLDKEEQKTVAARVATVRRAKNAGTLLSALSAKQKADPAVLLSRIQWLRRHDNNEKAWTLLRSAPKNGDALVDASDWWIERRIHVRSALDAGQRETAYAIARDHGPLAGEELSEAEFLAGWIALRFLDRPKAATDHFRAAVIAGGLPADRARASYWLARAEQALGNDRDAQTWLVEAAQHHHVYYGQLARQSLDADAPAPAVPQPVHPAAEEIDSFRSHHAVKAIIAARQADMESLVPLFLYELARGLDNPGEMMMLAELATKVGQPNQTIRLAKVALNRGFAVEDYAYPGSLPEFKSLLEGKAVESALLHALTRQESEFNPGAQSGVGARGLMQLMPATAKLVARTHKVKYDAERLTEDPAYNVMLGTAYLQQLIDNYDGSYIMALAGYNAGPGRVRQWVAQFGDPRDVDVDPIDWIERIPFTETRGYVHKIMESLQLYRWRLEGSKPRPQLAQDLHRGRTDAGHLTLQAGAAN